MSKPHANRDPLSRAALRQVAVLALAAVGGFTALLGALAWAASLTGAGTAANGAIDLENRAITVSIRYEPPQLDSTRATDAQSIMILAHTMEGLLRYDPQGRLVAGVAERWDIGDDGATFYLRDDALWSDGVPVTAHDFVFAWRTVVDPATAGPYAYNLYPIKNAEAINSGDLPPEALGARALDDRTLEVEFERPIAYFDKLAAFHTYLPVRQDFYESRRGRYGADAADLLYNGPFVMTRWVHGAHIRLEKNSRYWNRDEVQLNLIDIPYVTADNTARMNLFRDGEIADVDHLTSQELDQALAERFQIGRYADGSVWFLMPNHRPGRLTANYHFRKALQLATDNAELLYKVLRVPSYTPADSLFPAWLRGVDGLFKQEYPPPAVAHDPRAAREHLERARQELGLDAFPPLVLLADDSPLGSKKAEYLQALFRRELGLDVRIDKQIFKQRLAKAENGEFDIVIYGWGPDYDDPMTFADLFASWNTNNHGKFANAELDRHVRIAQESTDQRERMAAFAEVQRILIEEVAIIVNYERGVMYVQDPRLKNVMRRPMGGDPNYSFAYLADAP